MKYTANPVEVEAYKIVELDLRDSISQDPIWTKCGIALLDNGKGVVVGPEMTARYIPVVGDYWVIQSDGYEYVNPKSVFERKYHPGDVGSTSDGYHTFDELYQHRFELFLALGRELYRAGTSGLWCSRLHSDGTSIDGWFVAGIYHGRGDQISYHLPNSYWDEAIKSFKIFDHAPEYDGHTSTDVLERLRKL